MDFPVIDISRIDDPEAQQSIAKQITDASKTWGFLLLKNHPIPLKDIDHMFQLSHSFFADLPAEEKDPWPIGDNYIGYNAPLSDRKKDDKGSMWLSGKPGRLQECADSLPLFWRDKISEVDEFKHKCHGLIVKLLVCFAIAMELPDRNFFAKAHAEDGGVMNQGNQFRLLWYPAREERPGTEKTTRMSSHSDSGSVTLLFQTVAGLEVESPTGEWVPAPHLDGHILVNLGDALAFWSGGQLKATQHRVTFGGVAHNQERMTMAYFGAASGDTVLEPIKAEGKEKLRDYNANGVVIQPGITVGEYGRKIMENIYGVGVAKKIPLETSKVGEVSA